MNFSSRKAGTAPAAPRPERYPQVEFKFTQTGKFFIAAGSAREDGQTFFTPVLYISVVGEKGWANHYPLDGKFADGDAAAAAALHYGIQIITRQVRDVPRPDDPPSLPSDERHAP